MGLASPLQDRGLWVQLGLSVCQDAGGFFCSFFRCFPLRFGVPPFYIILLILSDVGRADNMNYVNLQGGLSVPSFCPRSASACSPFILSSTPCVAFSHTLRQCLAGAFVCWLISWVFLMLLVSSLSPQQGGLPHAPERSGVCHPCHGQAPARK